MKISRDYKSMFFKKLNFETSFGGAYLTAENLVELLNVSKSHAYRIIKTGKMTKAQRRLLECELFGAVHQWQGWTFQEGFFVSPDGYKYQESDLLRINTMKAVLKSYGYPIET